MITQQILLELLYNSNLLKINMSTYKMTLCCHMYGLRDAMYKKDVGCGYLHSLCMSCTLTSLHLVSVLFGTATTTSLNILESVFHTCMVRPKLPFALQASQSMKCCQVLLHERVLFNNTINVFKILVSYQYAYIENTLIHGTSYIDMKKVIAENSSRLKNKNNVES